MTLFINTEGKDGEYSVQWAAETGSVGGTMNISFAKACDDQKALAEIFALNVLLDRYPGKASCIMTSQGALKKLLRGADRFASTEIASLKIKHRTLSIKSDKKVQRNTLLALDLVESKISDDFEWCGLGRPSVKSKIGIIEITAHAMERYRERLCPTGTLSKLQALLNKDIYPVTSATKGGIIYSKYSIPELGVRFVVAAKESDPSQRRMSTCYAV
jgi:hypothetical protein